MNKYRNIKTVVDNITFDSKKEAARYQELKLMERAGELAWVELQPTYPIEVNGVKICTYKADFLYLENASGKRIVEDVKGVKTPAYRLKKKLMKAVYNIEVREV